MKKVFAILLTVLFLASLSVLGCKEAPQQEAAPKVEAPAAAPAAATAAPEAAATAATAAPAAATAAPAAPAK